MGAGHLRVFFRIHPRVEQPFQVHVLRPLVGGAKELPAHPVGVEPGLPVRHFFRREPAGLLRQGQPVRSHLPRHRLPGDRGRLRRRFRSGFLRDGGGSRQGLRDLEFRKGRVVPALPLLPQLIGDADPVEPRQQVLRRNGRQGHSVRQAPSR